MPLITRLGLFLALAALLSAGETQASGRYRKLSGGSLDRTRILVDRFEQCLAARDPDEYALQVSSAFSEGTLAGWIAEADVKTKRAAVYALGLFGSYEVNGAVARGLRDPDPIVRAMADRALRAIWFRAGTAEQNDRLRRIMVDIENQDFDRAIRLADELIKDAPGFAEAINQRAIAHYFAGRPLESSEDCKKVLERNPYHLGALSGLAQCLLKLDRRAEAIKVYRRASAVSPYDESLKAIIAELEALP